MHLLLHERPDHLNSPVLRGHADADRKIVWGIFGVHGEDRVKRQGILIHDAGFRMHDKAISDCGIIEEQ
jgi:hypothetical protein